MKMFAKFSITLAAAALALPVLPAAAQAAANPISLTGDVMVEKTITAPDGSERKELIAPSTIIPGDRLIFGTDYVNTGSEPMDNVVVTNPLPAAVRLAPDADPVLQVSVDNGATFGLLSALTLKSADGTSRPAAHTDVTHVRWVLNGVAPGTKGRLTFPAIIR